MDVTPNNKTNVSGHPTIYESKNKILYTVTLWYEPNRMQIEAELFKLSSGNETWCIDAQSPFQYLSLWALNLWRDLKSNFIQPYLWPHLKVIRQKAWTLQVHIVCFSLSNFSWHSISKWYTCISKSILQISSILGSYHRISWGAYN